MEKSDSGYQMPRRSYKIDNNNPGTDLAAETAAAMAAASILYREIGTSSNNLDKIVNTRGSAMRLSFPC